MRKLKWQASMLNMYHNVLSTVLYIYGKKHSRQTLTLLLFRPTKLSLKDSGTGFKPTTIWLKDSGTGLF